MIKAFDPRGDLIKHYALPIVDLWELEGVTSICINRYDTIYIRQHGEYILTESKFENENQLVKFISQVAKSLQQEINDDRPILDARMPDGTRINAILAVNSPKGSNVTIRLFPKVRYNVNDLLEKGMYSKDMLVYMQILIASYANILVSGQSGSGKTTLLNALGNLIPKDSRTLIIEDTAELDLNIDNLIQMEAPKRTLPEGIEPVTMSRLVINTLRQEPERTVVGEIRDTAAASALQVALNVGNKGVMSTLHANSADATLVRFQDMLLGNETRLPYDVLVKRTRSFIDAVIYADRTPRDGQRVVELAETHDDGLNILFRWDFVLGKHVRQFDDILKSSRIVKRALESGLVTKAYLSEAELI